MVAKTPPTEVGGVFICCNKKMKRIGAQPPRGIRRAAPSDRGRLTENGAAER